MKYCFFDIVIGGFPKGRIAFELYDDKYPVTSDNFYHLCLGDKKNNKGDTLWFKGSRFHNIRSDTHVILGGDFERGNGTGGESIYGATFKQEERKSGFEHAGSLAMVSVGEGLHEHSSLFFITADPDPAAFPTQNAFGRVIDGLELINYITQLGDSTGVPTQEVIIADCNAMPAAG